MSVLLKKVVWCRYDDLTTPIIITDGIDMNVNRGIDIKNNILMITLLNSAVRLDSESNLLHKYIDYTGNIMFQEQDQIKLYLKYTDDASDIEDDAWSSTSNTLPSSDYLKGVYYVIEFNTKHNNKGTPIKLKCADKCYVLFSKLLAKAFIESDSLTAPEIIQKVVRFSSQNQNGEYLGSGGDAGAKYDIDAKLVSESGYIQNTRKNTTEKGGVNADTTFPTVAVSKVWKPVYEWINELSQIESLNTSDELTNTSDIVYGRPFLYYVDEENKFHWFETDNTVDETITIGTTTGIFDYNLDKKVFDTVNFIIFRGGEDFYGKGTLDYYIEDTTNIKTLRMRVIAMTDIAKKLIQAEISSGNLVANSAGTFNFSGAKYNRNGNVSPAWNSTTYTNDSDYNTALKTEIYRIGNSRCRSLAKGLAHARYKGNMERKGSIVQVGNLLNITNINTGQKSELLRIMGVRDTINKTGWFSQLDIEQDQEAIIEGDVL